MNENIKDLTEWLHEIEPTLEYGHINISIIKHQGAITKIVRNVCDVEKIDQKKRDST